MDRAAEVSDEASARTEIPHVSIVVPHYNDVVRLTRCLEALARVDGIGQAEVIVADNGSDIDLTPARRALATLPRGSLIVEPSQGAGAARNCGAGAARGALLFFLDSDCVPEPDWLTAGAAAVERGDADVVGGDVAVFDETPPPRSGPEAFETVFAFDQHEYITRKRFSVSANLLMRREVFRRVGPFGVGLSEDVEWCHRAVARGLRLSYAPAARVLHPTRSDMAALVKKWRRTTREGFALYRRRPAGRVIWAGRAVAVLLSQIAHAPRIIASPDLLSPRERAAALATLVRLRTLRAVWMLRQSAGLSI